MVRRRSKEEAARETSGRPFKVSVTKRRVATVTARTPNRVRIIGGSWKRTPLAVADVHGLRPTPDRVRETLFNWIEHLIPALEAVRALDLFAGTGALGFELASRGALRVTLVENSRRVADQLAQTKHKLAADQIDIITGDALSAAAQWSDASFEIVFVDPPFNSSLLTPALATAARLIAPNGLIYVESGTAIDEALLQRHRLQMARESHAGRVHFYLLTRDSA
ncbi:MAG TPA: 16S rRNA (guanine(966)-N(2))-methyltransferase RsmD [Burkholderiaceae bacterium]|nr:16S rRNA (guanine(966)-N(2))-methyltransferase RsmD [Burkholderiaceae bacterium]